jgi:hypothetical protein
MSNGKGDSPRNCFSETYRENYDNIFRKKTLDGAQKPSKQEDIDNGKDKSTERGLRTTDR